MFFLKENVMEQGLDTETFWTSTRSFFRLGLISLALILIAGVEVAWSQCVQPLDDLVTWWPAEGNTSDIRSMNEGALVGGATFTDGAYGQGFNLDGIDDAVKVPDSPDLNFGTGDFSIDYWIRTTDTRNTTVVFDKRAQPLQGYTIYLTKGRPAVQLASGGSFRNYGPARSIADGRLHYVTTTIDRDSTTGGKIYVDGQLSAVFNPTGKAGSLDNPEELSIGMRSISLGGRGNVRAMVDELGMYKRVLSPEEIQTIYNARRCSTDLTISVVDHPDPAEVGDILDYEVTVSNLGTDTAVDVVVRSLLSSKVEYLSTTGCLSEGENLCSLGTVHGSESKIFTISARVLDASGVIDSIFEVETRTGDLNEENNVVLATTGAGTLYCTDDLNNRDTQVFSVDLSLGGDTSIGPVQPLADLETVLVKPDDLRLFGITAETGELWEIDKENGSLTAICTIETVRKFREIASSSFHPITGELWVYQWNRGLATINLSDCSLERKWNHPHQSGVVRKWDGIAWSPDGSLLYGSQRRDLYAWDPTTATVSVLCSNLPDKTEGLEFSLEGELHGSSDSKIYRIDPLTCQATEILNLPNRSDIESLAFSR